mgnify:CR=1 FL=1
MFHLSLHHKKPQQFSRSWYTELANYDKQKRVINRHYTEPYHRSLLAKSVHRACMKSFGFSGEAEMTALEVCKEVERWLEDKEEVTIADIKRRAAQALKKYNPRAAYEYLPSKEYAVKEDQYGFIRL